MFKRIIGYKTLLVVLVFIGSWIITLWSWRNHFRLPTAEEIATHFVFLPTALCLGYWGLYRVFEWLKRPRESVPSTGADEVGTERATEQLVQLQILDFSLYLPVGEEPSVVFQALQSRDRMGFHPTLKNAEGFAQRAAWIKTLDTADFVDARQGGHLPIDVRRALLLALEVVEPLLVRQLERGVSHGTESRGQLPVHFLVPHRWGAATQGAAQQWLQACLAQFAIRSLDCQVSIHVANTVRDTLSYIEQLRNSYALQPEQPLHVVIASDSFCPDDESSEFVQNPPGEGASGLLLGLTQSASLDLCAPIVHPFSSEQRPQSADLPGKVQSATLARLIQQATVAPSPIGRVMADADQRHSRQGETFAALHTTLPNLDPLGDCLHLPLCCGEMGAVTSLASLALAAAYTLETQKDTLLLSVQDPFWRAVCRIQPPVPEAQKLLQDLA